MAQVKHKETQRVVDVPDDHWALNDPEWEKVVEPEGELEPEGKPKKKKEGVSPDENL